jgi:hypothetical protein
MKEAFPGLARACYGFENTRGVFGSRNRRQLLQSLGAGGGYS